VAGGTGSVELEAGRLYFVIPLRNVGQGLAVLHSWRAEPRGLRPGEQPAPESFRRLQRDLYIPAGGTGFWQGAIRELEDDMRGGLDDAVAQVSRCSSICSTRLRGRPAHDQPLLARAH